jgi:Spx/MgsR family transcriptional regulator
MKFLEKNKIDFESFDISKTPPSVFELSEMLEFYEGDLKKLFNTSGQLYRELEIKNKINDFTKAQALKLLSQNGMLIRRPFLLSSGFFGILGFKEEVWKITI